MKHIPILFSTPMVQAIQEGRKSQTRRLVKPQPDDQPYIVTRSDQNESDWGKWLWETEDGESILKQCPYGQPGDVLWVRETWATDYLNDCFSPSQLPADTELYFFASSERRSEGKWRPSIHMPKWACRIFLKVKSVRVERLQDISQEDATAEGIKPCDRVKGFENWWTDYSANSIRCFAFPIASFSTLWISINGKESWDSNPWVWVVEFERCEKPTNFAD